MKSLQDKYILRNGVEVPCIGFGTWKMPDEVAENAVKAAIDTGYRHIDTAGAYMNEKGVGDGIKKSGVKRDEIFLVSKLPNDDHGYEKAIAACESSLLKLGTDYLDGYLIHWPVLVTNWDRLEDDLCDTWRAMMRLRDDGKVRAIGTSNFMTEHIEILKKNLGDYPLINQVQMHPQNPQDEMIAYCKENSVLPEAWSPLIQGQAFKRELLLELAEKRIYDIRNENQVKGLTRLNAVIVGILNELSELCANPDKQGIQGLKSGFPSLDKYIHGLNKSDLLIVAARPGMGKTSFAMNMATNVAKYHPEKSICVFNLEMSKEQLVKRMLSSEGRISSELMSTGRFDPAQWRNLADAAFVLSNMNIYIDDSSAITVNEMKAKLRRVDNLGLIVIDYLQLISSGRRDLNRVNEISEMTRNLKIMAKELNVPIIVLSQLARSAEKKDDKRPMLSDLRDSGSIEQDADIVLFLYRDSYYNKEAEDQRACKCIVAKNRHGETNDINMIWDGQYTRFTDVEYVHAEQ